jgi:hypothetical protein
MVCLDMSPTENVGDVHLNPDIPRDNKFQTMPPMTSNNQSSKQGLNQETQISQKKDPLISVIVKSTTDYIAATPTASLTPMS